MRILAKIFRNMKSYDGVGKINKDEFLSGLRDIGILFPKHDSEIIVQYFDKDIDGSVNFEEFLICIRGCPNQTRQEVIDKAFKKFDKRHDGYVDRRDLKGVFNASSHPKVYRGEMTKDQVFDEFLKNFNDHTGEGLIDQYEWNDYYSAVSEAVNSDEHFIKILEDVWQLS